MYPPLTMVTRRSRLATCNARHIELRETPAIAARSTSEGKRSPASQRCSANALFKNSSPFAMAGEAISAVVMLFLCGHAGHGKQVIYHKNQEGAIFFG